MRNVSFYVLMEIGVTSEKNSVLGVANSYAIAIRIFAQYHYRSNGILNDPDPLFFLSVKNVQFDAFKPL